MENDRRRFNCRVCHYVDHHPAWAGMASSVLALLRHERDHQRNHRRSHDVCRHARNGASIAALALLTVNPATSEIVLRQPHKKKRRMSTRRRRSLMAGYSSRQALEAIDVIDPERRPRILMVVANPGISKTLGWPVGFWASELFHPFYEFMQKLYEITVASPDGGPVAVDAWSDPRDSSGYSSEDLVSMGALNTPAIAALLEDTPAVRDLDLDEFDALLICGGQGPMWQDFRNRGDLKEALLHFYLAHKVTATLCHGT